MSATSPLPESYRHWQDCARGLLAPLAALMLPGRAELPIHGSPSDHDAQADRLESFARPLVLAAFWLQSAPRDEDKELRENVATWFRAGLVAGTDRTHPHYWGPDASYHQHHVEMGLMAIALQLGADTLWNPLSVEEKAVVAAWFATCRGGGIVNNNHLFMSVHILEFLESIGHAHRTDRAVIEAHLRQLETMYRGDGWFEDGINQAFDHYNAYAFHFYGLMWTRLHGSKNPERAERWRKWGGLFVRDYQYFFAASGEHPAFGRSITYRFNGLNVFGLAVAEGCTDLAPGMLRRLCTRNLDFFLRHPIYQKQGCLGPGFTDVFPEIVEAYSCAASPYWAAKGFTPLLLPPTHAFWTEPESPLPAERGFVHVMPVPGLITRSLPDGEVEILNAGSMVGNTQLRYGAWKWSKVSYRTGFHFTYAFPEISAVSPDGALVQELDDGRRFGRHSTVPVEMSSQHCGYSYNLGFKVGQVNTSVESYVFWRAGWLLQVHRYEARQPVRLTAGGFALPHASSEVFSLHAEPRYLVAWTPERGTALQLLQGQLRPGWDQRLDAKSPRRHLAAPYHVTPLFGGDRHEGAQVVVVAAWAGSAREEAAPWRLQRAESGHWILEHPSLGTWDLQHWSLPAIST